MRPIVLAALVLAPLLACSGDTREELDALAREGASCTTADDCCVVMHGCTGGAWVVGRDDLAEADSLRDDLDRDNCAKCGGPPSVELACVEGRCVGLELRFEDATAPAHGDHCGAVLEPDPELPAVDEGVVLGCG